MTTAFIDGFIKRAMAHGLTESESIQMLKEAAGVGSAIMGGIGDIGKAIGESGPGQWAKQTFGGGAPVGINKMLRGSSGNAQGNAYAAGRLPQLQQRYGQISEQVDKMRRAQIQNITQASEQEQLAQLMKQREGARIAMEKAKAMKSNQPGMMQSMGHGLSEQFGNHLNWMAPAAGVGALGGGAMMMSGGQKSASDKAILNEVKRLTKEAIANPMGMMKGLGSLAHGGEELAGGMMKNLNANRPWEGPGLPMPISRPNAGAFGAPQSPMPKPAPFNMSSPSMMAQAMRPNPKLMGGIGRPISASTSGSKLVSGTGVAGAAGAAGMYAQDHMNTIAPWLKQQWQQGSMMPSSVSHGLEQFGEALGQH
jgi:hypothetical protein